MTHDIVSRSGWRLALLAAGPLMVAGGAMHPDEGDSGSVRQELATMTADDRWVTGHALVLASTVLIALGLWGAAARASGWPVHARRPLRLAALAMTAYVVEAAFHLAAVVDSTALRDGESAPVAFAHLALSVVVYPVSGAAIAALGLALVRAWTGPRRAVGALAVLAGTLHALSVPITLLLPDAETTPLFAGAAVLLSLWSVATAVVGAPRPAPAVTHPATPVAV